MTNAIVFVVLAGVSVLAWRQRPRRLGWALTCGGLALLMVVRAVQHAVFWLTGAGALTITGLIGVLVLVGAGLAYRFAHSRALVGRWARALRRKSGVASTVDIARIGSAVAMRRQAKVLRPSLANLRFWQRLRTATTEFAVPLCRAGALRVWASNEDVVLVFGGPRHGKSGWLGCQILDAPGAVIVTSTKTDVYTATAALRAGRGPVHVFNPTGVGGLDSTLTFNPVSGCDNPLTAAERAEDMLPAGGDGEHEHWVAQAREALAGLLHAAALGGLPMQTIAAWAADPDAAKAEVLALLRRSPDRTAAYATAVEQFLSTNDRTRSSITSTMRPALKWLVNPHACAAASGDDQFNVAELLRTHGTVYLLGSMDGTTASLVAALTGYIAREARRIASNQPTGRLDPPLRLCLDEAAQICPIPLDRWTADMGGLGIQIIAAFQGRAQLFEKWGTHAASTIINNAGAIMLFGGGNDENDLRSWSTLLGDRDEETITTDQHGRVTSRSMRQVPVFTPAQLSTLPKFRVVVKRRHMAPVIGRAAMFWDRADIRPQTRAIRDADRAVVAAAEEATRAPVVLPASFASTEHSTAVQEVADVQH